jgi:formylglycine-generating enzyme required for sulfatase activity
MTAGMECRQCSYFLKRNFSAFNFFSTLIYPLKTNKIMKKSLLSLFSLLLLFAAATTATAQEPKPKLAVLVVGMDDWMLGDVLAHLVGEELNRGKSYDVVTRRNDVQNKLKALRYGYDRLDDYFLRAWGSAQGIASLCVVTTSGGNFSAKLFDLSVGGGEQCSGSSVGLSAVALKQLAWSLAGSLGSGCTPYVSLNSYTESEIGLEMVYVEGDKFVMGCVSGRDDLNGYSCDNREKPADTVSVGSFWIGKYEVTQEQWEAVMGSTITQQRDKVGSADNYSLEGVGGIYPMYYVSWNEAKAFCDTLSLRTGKSYRLATEEEWEYAARGGKRSRGYVYSGSNSIDSVAWYTSNSGIDGVSTNRHAHAVGTTTKRGNELGICDMSGNVWEWCSSNWRANYSASEDGSYRVIRGGSWHSVALYGRVAYRNYNDPSNRGSTVGFRVV